MASSTERLHSKRLEDLCKWNGLRQIDEVPELVRLIIKEPTYKQYGLDKNIMCPDLFINYYNQNWTIAELKHSRRRTQNAYEQIESGMKLLVDVFGVSLKNITGKLVIYTPEEFYYEIMKCKF